MRIIDHNNETFKVFFRGERVALTLRQWLELAGIDTPPICNASDGCGPLNSKNEEAGEDCDNKTAIHAKKWSPPYRMTGVDIEVTPPSFRAPV